jgi:hypothetical protein
MLVFARFVMRDSGLPIHINTPHVTQIRLTIDGEPAIYLVGKESPIVVEGTLEGALKKLEAAAAGLRLVEAEPAELAPPSPVTAVVTVLPGVDAPAVAPPPAAKVKPPSPKKVAAKAGASAKAKAVKADGPAEPVKPAATSWFKGLR